MSPVLIISGSLGPKTRGEHQRYSLLQAGGFVFAFETQKDSLLIHFSCFRCIRPSEPLRGGVGIVTGRSGPSE